MRTSEPRVSFKMRPHDCFFPHFVLAILSTHFSKKNSATFFVLPVVGLSLGMTINHKQMGKRGDKKYFCLAVSHMEECDKGTEAYLCREKK